MDAATFYRERLRDIDEAIIFICRRNGLDRDEEKDFAQHVHLRLIENDYAKLRAFRGISSLKSFLYTVISRIFIDQVRTKWHPSAEATRMGSAAVKLEELVYRNRYAVHEACKILAADPATAIAEETAYALLARLQTRTLRPTRVDDAEDLLPRYPDPTPDPEMRLIRKQRLEKKRALVAIAGTVARSLEPEDRFLMRMLYVGDLRVSDIARLLKRKDKTLYKRTKTILRDMRKAIAEGGISEADVRDILENMEDIDE